MEDSMTVIHSGKRKRTSTENYEQKRKINEGISDLGDDTLCYILSLLSTKDAARTSILSKRWKNLWKSTGIIKLDMDEVLRVLPHVNNEVPQPNQRIEEFIRVVTQSLCENLNPFTRTLHLHLCSGLPNAHTNILDYWFTLVMQSQLDNLVLDFSGAPGHYCVPYNLLFHEGDGLRLKSLSLTRCDLLRPCNAELNHYCSSLVSLAFVDVNLPENFVDIIFCCPQLRYLTIQECSMQHIEVKILSGGFEHLRMLKLRYVELTQELLNNLLANFFLLEQLFLEDCNTVPSDASPLEIYGPINLDCLKLSKCCGLKQLRVFATSLKRFAFISNNDMDCLPRVTFELLDFHDSKFSSIEGSRPLLKHLDLKCIEFPIDLPQFSSLKTVTLDEVHLEEDDITVLLSNCLLLEKLSIIRCDGLPLLSIIGPSLQLKQLIVMWCSHLKEIEICDVNLVQLEYHGDMIVFSLTNVSHLVSIEMEIYTNDDGSLTNILSMLSKDVPRLETLIFYIEGGKVPESPPMFYNLKHLELFLGRYIFTEEFPWTTLFLAVSPFLEKFHLQLSRCLIEDTILGTRKPTSLADWTFTNRYLKEIKLSGFKGDSKLEIELAQLLLQNLKSLKLMKISGESRHKYGWHAVAPPSEWVQNGRQKTLHEMSKIDVPGGVELLIL